MQPSNRGVIQRGRVKITPSQQKKHIQQMTQEEVSYLVQRLKRIRSKLKPSLHLKQSHVRFSFEDVERLILSQDLESMIVEYNETQRDIIDQRVLLRDNQPQWVEFETEMKLAHLCVVISIRTGRVVTAYWNLIDDHHRTINWERYQKDLMILPQK